MVIGIFMVVFFGLIFILGCFFIFLDVDKFLNVFGGFFMLVIFVIVMGSKVGGVVLLFLIILNVIIVW